MAISFISCEKEESIVSDDSKSQEAAENHFLKASKKVIPSASEIDCSVFEGVEIRKFFSSTWAGVKTLSINDIDPNSVTWTVNGEEVDAFRPQLLRVNNHVSQPGSVEVCYTSVSSSCGVLQSCTTFDFSL